MTVAKLNRLCRNDCGRFAERHRQYCAECRAERERKPSHKCADCGAPVEGNSLFCHKHRYERGLLRGPRSDSNYYHEAHEEKEKKHD